MSDRYDSYDASLDRDLDAEAESEIVASLSPELRAIYETAKARAEAAGYAISEEAEPELEAAAPEPEAAPSDPQLSQLAIGDLFSDEMTLGEARDVLSRLIDEGYSCPCCSQFAKVYRRKLSNATARMMIALYRAQSGGGYAFLPTLLSDGGDVDLALQGGYATVGHHWGLIEQRVGRREDGSKNVGWWRLTSLGLRFVRGEVSVPGYARIYDGRCLGLDGEGVTIGDALGERFDYRELMEGV